MTNRSSPTSWTSSTRAARSAAPSRPSRPHRGRPRSKRAGTRRRARPDVVDHLLRRELAASTLVAAGPVHLGGGDVERKGDVLARGVAGRLDGLDENLESGPVGREGWGQTRLRRRRWSSGRVRRAPSSGPGRPRRRPAAPRETSADRPGTSMNSWMSTRVGGVGAAVEDVETRHRQHSRRGSPEVPVEREARPRQPPPGWPPARPPGSRSPRASPCWACRRDRASPDRCAPAGWRPCRRAQERSRC